MGYFKIPVSTPALAKSSLVSLLMMLQCRNIHLSISPKIRPVSIKQNKPIVQKLHKTNKYSKLMRFHLVISVIFITWSLKVTGQQTDVLRRQSDYSGDERAFYAETKQVSQFFRRFNAEEDQMGVRLSPKDSNYRSRQLRRLYIQRLFDQESNIPVLLKDAFINDMTHRDKQKFLDFHGGDWFAEALVNFQRGNNQVVVTLFMKLVKENLGSKWVIEDVYYSPYQDLYKRDEKSSSRFLHPLSHELDFMNLDKVFSSGIHMADYFTQDYQVDRLSIFLYELRSRVLKFKYVSKLKLHFFQIDGWYIELTEFNRPGMNRGWLISNLIKLEDGEDEKLKDFIYHE